MSTTPDPASRSNRDLATSSIVKPVRDKEASAAASAAAAVCGRRTTRSVRPTASSNKVAFKAPYRTSRSMNIDSLNEFLDNERSENRQQKWAKLDKTVRRDKLRRFVATYRNEHELTDAEADALVAFLHEALDRNKLQRVKEVTYDPASGDIQEIPALVFHADARRFTLRTMQKRAVVAACPVAPQKRAKPLILYEENDLDEFETIQVDPTN